MCPRPRFEVIWCDEPSLDQASLVWAASFYVPTLEKIPGVKMGLWQLPLLCLVFLGTKNVGQRINDSIFARWNFLNFRAYPQVLQKIFLNLRVTLCQTRWLSIGWHMGQKLRYVLDSWFSLKTLLFLLLLSFSLLAQISRFGSPFALLRYVAMCAPLAGVEILKNIV